MKKFIEKTCKVLGIIYGYGILITLFAGGLTFFGYVVALCIGGDTATKICTVIYKEILPIIIITGSVMVVLGVIKMYLSGEVALSIEKKRKSSKEKKEKKANVSTKENNGAQEKEESKN